MCALRPNTEMIGEKAFTFSELAEHSSISFTNQNVSIYPKVYFAHDLMKHAKITWAPFLSILRSILHAKLSIIWSKKAVCDSNCIKNIISHSIFKHRAVGTILCYLLVLWNGFWNPLLFISLDCLVLILQNKKIDLGYLFQSLQLLLLHLQKDASGNQEKQLNGDRYMHAGTQKPSS